MRLLKRVLAYITQANREGWERGQHHNESAAHFAHRLLRVYSPHCQRCINDPDSPF